jgi:hypothetical protein
MLEFQTYMLHFSDIKCIRYFLLAETFLFWQAMNLPPNRLLVKSVGIGPWAPHARFGPAVGPIHGQAGTPSQQRFPKTAGKPSIRAAEIHFDVTYQSCGGLQHVKHTYNLKNG